MGIILWPFLIIGEIAIKGALSIAFYCLIRDWSLPYVREKFKSDGGLMRKEAIAGGIVILCLLVGVVQLEKIFAGHGLLPVQYYQDRLDVTFDFTRQVDMQDN